MKLKIKLCQIAERDHKKELRNYAHWGHKPNTICISKSIYSLPLNHSLALIAHEVGHALIKGGSEEEANKAAEQYLSAPIIYLPKTPWGNRLQYIPNWYFERVYERLKHYVEKSFLRSFRPPQ